jgi:hypothetical protein
MFGRARGGSDYKTDPEARALLYVQQYLAERGAREALQALERSAGMRFDEDKLKSGDGGEDGAASSSAHRAGALMSLVYGEMEREAMAAAGATSGPGDDDSDDEAREELMRAAVKAPSRLATRHAGVVSAQAQGQRGNLLCVRVLPPEFALAEDDGDEEQQQRPLLVASGAADGSVCLHRLPRGAAAAAGPLPTLAWTYHPSTAGGAGGVLSIDAAAWDQEGEQGGGSRPPECWLAAASMDGTVTVLDARTGQALARARARAKYVVRARWAPRAFERSSEEDGDGEEEEEAGAAIGPPRLLATASYDGSAAVLRVVDEEEDEERRQEPDDEDEERERPLEQLLLAEAAPRTMRLELVRRARFPGAVLDVAFVRGGEDEQTSNPSSSPPLLLLAAVRGSSFLAALDGQRGFRPAAWLCAGRGLPLSADGGPDGRAPFSAVRLAVSPCGLRLLVATDGARVLVLRQRRRRRGQAAGWSHLPPLFGVGAPDPFHVASLAWHRSGAHAYVSTAGVGAAAAATVAQGGGGSGDGGGAAAAGSSGGGHLPLSQPGEVLIFEVGSARVVGRVPAHSPLAARDLDYCPGANALATCAFDRSLRLFLGGGGGGGGG